MMNKVETQNPVINGQTEVNQTAYDQLSFAAKALGKSILSSAPYVNFINARDKFRTDKKAKEVALDYNTLLNDFQMRARWGGITADDYSIIEEAQKKAMHNEVFRNFHTSRESLTVFLKEINTYLSEKLTFNFAGLARPAGGCCG